MISSSAEYSMAALNVHGWSTVPHVASRDPFVAVAIRVTTSRASIILLLLLLLLLLPLFLVCDIRVDRSNKPGGCIASDNDTVARRTNTTKPTSLQATRSHDGGMLVRHVLLQACATINKGGRGEGSWLLEEGWLWLVVVGCGWLW
jgi:hypothetical protein